MYHEQRPLTDYYFPHNLTAVRKALLPVANALDHPDLAEAHAARVRRGSNMSEVALLLEQPALLDLIRFRCLTMTRVQGEIRSALHRARPGIQFCDNAQLKRFPEFAGWHYGRLGGVIDAVRSPDYSERSGQVAKLEDKRKFLPQLRAGPGDAMPVLSGIGIRPKATPETMMGLRGGVCRRPDRDWTKRGSAGRAEKKWTAKAFARAVRRSKEWDEERNSRLGSR
jgi:hypothetical protein